MRVPLIPLHEVVSFLDRKNAEGFSSDWVDVDLDAHEGCFALNLSDFQDHSLVPEKGIAVFSIRFDQGEALDNVYLLRKPDGTPDLCQMVRSETKVGDKGMYRASRRKSFMTPTPLHIPTSKVSPIPDYTHSVFYLKPSGQEKLEVVSTGQSGRLLPLLFIKTNG